MSIVVCVMPVARAMRSVAATASRMNPAIPTEASSGSSRRRAETTASGGQHEHRRRERHRVVRDRGGRDLRHET
jgi:hypothetical protein